MFTYKGFTVYCTASQQWRVQSGYEVFGTYNTLGGAKRAITTMIKREV